MTDTHVFIACVAILLISSLYIVWIEGRGR